MSGVSVSSGGDLCEEFFDGADGVVFAGVLEGVDGLSEVPVGIGSGAVHPSAMRLAGELSGDGGLEVMPKDVGAEGFDERGGTVGELGRFLDIPKAVFCAEYLKRVGNCDEVLTEGIAVGVEEVVDSGGSGLEQLIAVGGSE